MSNDTAGGSAYRYRLLRTAQSILAKAGLTWKEQHRTCWCSRSILYGDEGSGALGYVGFYRNEKRTNSSMRGLQRCGKLHTCPICAAKVAELRRKQLSAAMARHIENGQTPAQKKNQTPGKTTAYLITQTFSHTADESLKELQDKFSKARAKFQNSRQWKSFRKNHGVVGCVNSFEHTVSVENGWHPHVHMLVFCDSQAFDEGAPAENGDLNSPAIKELSDLWVKFLLECDLGSKQKENDMKLHAFNVRGGEKAAEYIAKFGHDERWGASSEITQAHAKIGSAGERDGMMHFTPFQLLVWAEQGDGWAIHRFREFADEVDGKRALTWSPGLKEKLGVLDVDEDEWAKRDDNQPEQIYVGELTAEQFSIVQSRKRVDELLEYVATCADSTGDLVEFVDSLRTLPPVASGALLIKRKEGRAVAFVT